MDEVKKDEMKKTLTDEDLEGVSGGAIQDVYDRRGRKIGRFFLESTEMWTGRKIYCTIYYACAKCGKPVHIGTMNMYYCDPCDRWQMSAQQRRFEGSLEEFQAWANSK